MNFLKILCVVFASAFCSFVRTQEICDFEDDTCVTKGLANAYATLVAGVEDVIEPMDSLLLEKINGEADSLKYELTNVRLTGLTNCHVILLHFHPEEPRFNADLYCPQLNIDLNYKAKGVFGPANIDSEGTATVTLEKYVITLNGIYSQTISEKDQKPYFSLDGYTIDTELKGKLSIDYKTSVRQDNDQMDVAAAYFNENNKDMEKYVRSPIIDKFMDLLMEKAKIFIGMFSVDKIIPK